MLLPEMGKHSTGRGQVKGDAATATACASVHVKGTTRLQRTNCAHQTTQKEQKQRASQTYVVSGGYGQAVMRMHS